jgi:hypothetical protein
MEIMEWWWRFGDGNGAGGSEMEMRFFFACPLRPLRCRGGRIAEGGCEHVMGLEAGDEMFNSYPNCARAEILFFLK